MDKNRKKNELKQMDYNQLEVSDEDELQTEDQADTEDKNDGEDDSDKNDKSEEMEVDLPASPIQLQSSDDDMHDFPVVGNSMVISSDEDYPVEPVPKRRRILVISDTDDVPMQSPIASSDENMDAKTKTNLISSSEDNEAENFPVSSIYT